ncbi:MAG: GAF domain-containing protein [Anaerolineales bacterium]|nr:GAF domain-containing protein [Anaerolineales bacterium]
MLYAAVTGTAVTIFFIISPNYSISDINAFLLTMVGVCFTFWMTARDLKNVTDTSKHLLTEIQTKNTLLQRRARQLQLSAEVSQRSSLSLNLETLLHNTVYLIRDQYGFYYVSIFLLDEHESQLVLREATGEIGKQLKDAVFQLPVDESSIIGWVATNQKPYISHIVGQDPIFYRQPNIDETESELCLPLIARGKLLGVLDVQSRRKNVFQEESIAILQIMANQVAVNLDNANLFAATESQLNETKVLHDLNTLLTTTLEVGEIYRRAAREFVLQLDVTRCAVSSWDKEENSITIQAEFVHDEQNNLIDEYVTRYEKYDLAQHPLSQKVLTSHTYELYQVQAEKIPDADRAFLERLDQVVFLELPLVFGVQALGTVKLFRDKTQPAFAEREIQLAQAMANQTAIALNNAILTSNTRAQLAQFSSLHRMSVILSQAPNLKAIFDGARREILSLVEATGMSISLLTEDGRKLNWIYGYEFGQEVDLSAIPPLSIMEGFSGYVARTREVLYVPQAHEVRNKFESVTVGADMGCWLGLPMIVANKLIGVLAVENDIAFTSRDIDLLKTIAGPLAITIHNLIQFEEIQDALKVQMRQRVQLEAAAEVAAAAASYLDVNELMQNAVNLIKVQFELYYVGLFTVEGTQAVLRAGTGIAGQRQIEAQHHLEIGGRSLIGGATADGQARIIQDVQLDQEWYRNPYLPETRSELALPLRVRGQIIGALTVQSVKPNIFNQELLKTLQTMADQLAIAIDNARLLAEAEAEARDQQKIHQVSSQFYQSTDVNRIVQLGLGAISERLGGKGVQLQLGTNRRDEDGTETNGTQDIA